MRIRKVAVALILMFVGAILIPAGITWVQGEGAPSTNTRTVEQFRPMTVIEDFESTDSLLTWDADENVSSVSIISSAHDVFYPFEGDHFLQIISSPDLQNNIWRTASGTFKTPLDLSEYRYLMLGYDHFGYLPNDEPYYARLKVFSGDQSMEGIVQVYNNQWNKIGLDISNWVGRSAIDKLEIGFLHDYDRADYPDDPLPNWPHTEFYIDYIHAANDLGWQFSYDGDHEGWHFNSTVVSTLVEDGYLAMQMDGTAPTMTSSTTRLEAGENNRISIGMINQTDVESATLYWSTSENPEFDFLRSQKFDLMPEHEELQHTVISLFGHPAWKGEITKLKIVFDGEAEGILKIDGFNFSKQERPDYVYVGIVHPISVDERELTITGTVGEQWIDEGGMVELYELSPYQYEPDAALLEPIHTQPLQSSGEFEFSVDRINKNRDRYYSKFLVAIRNGSELNFVDRPKYVSDIRFLAEHDIDYPEPASKKGLNVQMTDDAELLGVSHSTITVVINGMMYKDTIDFENAIEFQSGGETYYFRKDYLAELDGEIKSMSDNGAIVNLVLILYDSDDPDSATEILIHPDAARGQGTVYAFNTTDDDGIRYYISAMEFLASRYTQEDEKHGRALGYIVGNEVDSAWVWQNMGDKPVDQFMEHYERSVRLAYLAVRKYSDAARVYISLDNAWNEPYFANQTTRFYKGKDIIDIMNQLSKQGGDYPWHLAHHPYPENMLVPTTWADDQKVEESFDTPKITFKNLNVLPEYMNQERVLYDGQARRIILSEQGFHTADSSIETQRLQAAAYAYAYYKAEFQQGIDAFIMFNQLDIPSAGLNMGLWTQDPDKPGFVAKDKKFIYDVFKYIDTERSLEVTEFAKTIIGIEDWNEVVPGFDTSQLKKRELPQLVPVTINQQAPVIQHSNSFETDVEGWESADHAKSVEVHTGDAYIGQGSLKADFYEVKNILFVGLEKRWKGVQKIFNQPIDASKVPYLNLALKTTEPLDKTKYVARVRVYSGNMVAEGMARVDSAQGWNDLSLNLSEWDGKHAIDRIKVWIKKETDESWNGSLLIDHVGFSKQDRSTAALLNIDFALGLDQEAEGQYTVHVTNYGPRGLSGRVSLTPVGEFTLSPNWFILNNLEFNEQQSFTIQLHNMTDQEVTGIKFRYRNMEQTVWFNAIE